MEIAKINGIPVLGNQGKGSITDAAVRRLLTLQGTMKPAQIITLMKYEDTDNTLAMGDHADHIHVGFRPALDPSSKDARTLRAVLKPSKWIKLIDRIGAIKNPTVRATPSKYAIPAPGPPARVPLAPRRVTLPPRGRSSAASPRIGCGWAPASTAAAKPAPVVLWGRRRGRRGRCGRRALRSWSLGRRT